MRSCPRLRVGLLGIAGLLLVTLFASASVAAPPEIRIDPGAPLEATDASGADGTYHVKAFDPATGDPVAATCDIPAGTSGSGDFDSPSNHFPLGSTTVTCTATLSGFSASASVVVQDTIAPAFSTLPDVNDTTSDAAGKNVSYTVPSATDAVSGSIPGNCTPASDSHFNVGSTPVTCTATDSSGNVGTASFNVVLTLLDTTPPTFTTVPSPPPQEATGPSGAVVTYVIEATDNSGVTPTITCDHPSGSTFPITTTPVSCTATDGANNSSAPATFNVTVNDTTAPTLSLPSDLTVSSGASVTWSATATDVVDGSVSVTCAPASGSSFPLGTTTVTCSAKDVHNNTANGSFHVTVQDQIPPVLAGVPSNIQVEANGPGGSIVTFTKPTATDDVDGPIASVGCSPAAGSTFPVGTTTVTCSATDSSGNTGSTSFTVRVVDTTPPHLIVPGDFSVYATSADGISSSEGGASAFISHYSVSDIADPSPIVTTDSPPIFPVGKTLVTFTARDASGNVTTATSTLTVRPEPAPGTTPEPLPPLGDVQAPDDVRSLTVAAGDGVVTLTWKPPTAADFASVTVTRSPTAGGASTVVYRGTATTFADHGVENGVEYRYVVVAVDKSGNASAGAAVVAKPLRSMLRTPASGARLSKAPRRLAWLPADGATYYNVQLFRGDVKILSAWPAKPRLVLKKTWKYQGHRYRLTRGVYQWFVWPGLGARAKIQYGPLLGSSTFTIIR